MAKYKGYIKLVIKLHQILRASYYKNGGKGWEALHWMNHYLSDKSVGFDSSQPLDSYFSGAIHL